GTQIVAGEVRLATDDTKVQRLRDADIALEVFRPNRLFEPVDIVLFELAAHLDRGVCRPGHVDVDHDIDVGSDGIAHLPHVLDIGTGVVEMPHLHLDRPISLPDIGLGFFGHSVATKATPAAATVYRHFAPVVAPEPVQRQLRL